MGNFILKVENLNVSVGGKRVIKDLSFGVRKREIYSLIGVNGSGKTTLAGVLMGLSGYKILKGGKIFFEGKEITRLSITQRARLGLSLSWQIPASFENLKVKDYLNLKKSSVNPEKALELVGLKPEKYLEKNLGKNLSGGERKRIELASVFSFQPKLAILDEPDSGVDIPSLKIIKEAILKFKKLGGSVLLITHNERMVQLSQRAALLCGGMIVKESEPKKIMGFFKKYCKNCKNPGEIKEELIKYAF